jgi:hypothetical protein
MLNSLQSQFGTNTVRETEGIWIPLGSCKVKIARPGGANKAYLKAAMTAFRPYRRQIDLGVANETVMTEIAAELYSKHVVLDWEEVTDADGNPIPYSSAAMKTSLIETPELFVELRRFADDLNVWRSEALEPIVKN